MEDEASISLSPSIIFKRTASSPALPVTPVSSSMERGAFAVWEEVATAVDVICSLSRAHQLPVASSAGRATERRDTK